MPFHMVVFVISDCGMNCPFCNQKPWREAHPRYEMPMSDLHLLIRRAQELGVVFDAVEFTGGEATLWPHFKEASRLVMESGIAKRMDTVTNGIAWHVLTDPDLLQWYPTIKLSTSHPHPDSHDALRRVWGDRLLENSMLHVRVPTEVNADYLPARCSIPTYVAYFDRVVYYCCCTWSTCAHIGMDVKSDPELWCPVEDDFVAHFANRKFDKPICSVCLNNSRNLKRLWGI